MTRQHAVQRLFYVWVVGGVLLGLLLLTQSIAGKYGQDHAAAWSWFLSIVTAPFSLLAVAAFVDSRASWRDAAANRFKFWAAIGGSAAMLLVGLGTLLIEPLVEMTSYDLFAQTGILLAVLQGIVMAAVGAVVFDRR